MEARPWQNFQGYKYDHDQAQPALLESRCSQSSLALQALQGTLLVDPLVSSSAQPAKRAMLALQGPELSFTVELHNHLMGP